LFAHEQAASDESKKQGPEAFGGWMANILMTAGILASMACSVICLKMGHVTLH
jgi:hypothetical protein